MLAIELVNDPATKEPAPELARAVIDAALQRGLILLKAGIPGNCIRVLCPLTIEDAVLDEALAVWEDALAAVLALEAAATQNSSSLRRSWRSSASATRRSSSSA